MGNIFTIFLFHASMESMEISPSKPWDFALAPCSMVFKVIHEIFPMLFPWISHAFSIRENLEFRPTSKISDVIILRTMSFETGIVKVYKTYKIQVKFTEFLL